MGVNGILVDHFGPARVEITKIHWVWGNGATEHHAGKGGS